ncbi:DUF2800 domain-containing protein [Veillonella magna]|uniref:DUF2800 domain-containing protein n=1 Tax=Veillonella magna TaxID=464322 RepID=UPI0023F3BC99|nr:DUF2800 domain-containing protein [Veillonella magna]
MANKHALLSASSSHRWIACPPSAMLCAKEKDVFSEYAKQGTDAHSLCEHKLKILLGMETCDPTETLDFFDQEMADASDAYAQFVMEQVEAGKETCKDILVLVEQKLDFSRWVPDGFGTGDCMIVADDTLRVIDFKYGVGVLVDAENNPQMMCYALGALQMFEGIYDISSIAMTIFQPRRDNISTFVLSKEELLKWAEEVLSPAAKLAAKGEGEFHAGNHCQFCKVKATCRKRAEYNLELARYDFAVPASLTDEEVEIILFKADELTSWTTDIKEYALQQALSGKAWSGWKLVEGRANRKYINESAVAEKVKSAGFAPYDHKVLGITAMTKLLGKTKFEELLEGLIEKPQGKPTLVPMSDKRPAMHTAVNDFKEEN